MRYALDLLVRELRHRPVQHVDSFRTEVIGQSTHAVRWVIAVARAAGDAKTHVAASNDVRPSEVDNHLSPKYSPHAIALLKAIDISAASDEISLGTFLICCNAM